MPSRVNPRDRFDDMDYGDALDEGKKHLEAFGNWAVHPCMYKYGVDVVTKDLSAEVDHDIKVRETVMQGYTGAVSGRTARGHSTRIWIAEGDAPGFKAKMQ